MHQWRLSAAKNKQKKKTLQFLRKLKVKLHCHSHSMPGIKVIVDPTLCSSVDSLPLSTAHTCGSVFVV